FIPTFVHESGKVSVRVTNQLAGKYPVRYTLNGTSPTAASPVYTSPLLLETSTSVTTAVFDRTGKKLGKQNRQVFTFNKATGKGISVSYATPGVTAASNSLGSSTLGAYDTTATAEVAPITEDAPPPRQLADGIFGTIEPYDGRWQFYSDSIITVTIDLGKPTSMDSLKFRCLEDQVGLSYLPGSYSVLVGDDGVNFKQFQTGTNNKVPEQALRHIKQFNIPMKKTTARYVRLILNRAAALPSATAKPTMFIDEIEIF
ncbi:MAG: hypothetical protein EOO05_21825, partial [Chitinophagaceae bacterium]